jgi:hypothetical protein
MAPAIGWLRAECWCGAGERVTPKQQLPVADLLQRGTWARRCAVRAAIDCTGRTPARSRIRPSSGCAIAVPLADVFRIDEAVRHP